ncbi:hypothetical protein HZU67_07153 [Apis mellifera carnica]|nr:hypothetical protein HZU67_07153 [Apis mellifera carnica]
MAALLEVVLDLILCKWNNSEFQVLIEEVKSFVEMANEYEIKILQGYVNRYKKFFSTVSMGYISTAISFSLMPLFSAQKLPADGWLPFSTEPFGIYCIIYFNHVYCILQTAFCIFVDFTIVILFSFPAAKLDVLRSKLRHVNNYDTLVSCIKEHQKIIGFVEDTKATVETLLFKTNVTMGSTVMCGAFPLLNVLIEEVKSFLEMASEYEIKILQGYINRYKKFFSTVSMGYILPASSFILMPLFSAQELPAEGWLPFSIEPLGIYCVVYVNHIYCILQTSFCIFVDFTIVILFSFPAAKLDVLRSKLRHVNNYDMLVSCIKEHQKILGFVEDTNATVETLLFKTNVTMGSTVICGAFPLLNNQSLDVVTQFLPLVLSGMLHLFVISWPADDLRESSIQFAESISDIQWLGQSKKMKSCMIFMMIRSQKLFLIRMSSLLPPLSLEYCSNFVTTVSSYFMAMRTMIES